MINLSQSFIDEGIQIGIKQGIQIGTQQGIQINQKDTAANYAKLIKSGIPAKQLFETIDASKDIIDMVNEILNNDN